MTPCPRATPAVPPAEPEPTSCSEIRNKYVVTFQLRVMCERRIEAARESANARPPAAATDTAARKKVEENRTE